ncbi:hypothetical protein F0562_030062 [Nyssa sinensis]|uniref:Bulb-type lectin domain-containing protein n=1 Tax=Nyssa sinensis TaxID=561372 RepID=A0A5J5AXB3_9ASTE|nr:hypothetical protein F0562_030062 [Nyssa sinensis]
MSSVGDEQEQSFDREWSDQQRLVRVLRKLPMSSVCDEQETRHGNVVNVKNVAIGFPFLWSILRGLAQMHSFDVTQKAKKGNTLKLGQVMGGREHLESLNKKFRLQFMEVGFRDWSYLVIQYMGSTADSTVWIANQDYPQYYYSTILNFTLDGFLVIHDGYGTFIQLNTEKPSMSSDTSATLEDSGNFVLKEGERILWQSSDHPTDTLLPGMKLRWFDLKSGQP